MVRAEPRLRDSRAVGHGILALRVTEVGTQVILNLSGDMVVCSHGSDGPHVVGSWGPLQEGLS